MSSKLVTTIEEAELDETPSCHLKKKAWFQLLDIIQVTSLPKSYLLFRILVSPVKQNSQME